MVFYGYGVGFAFAGWWLVLVRGMKMVVTMLVKCTVFTFYLAFSFFSFCEVGI